MQEAYGENLDNSTIFAMHAERVHKRTKRLYIGNKAPQEA